MKTLTRAIGAGLALAMSAGMAVAAPSDPTGIWQAEDGDSRYEISFCGDGTQLCAELIWIRPEVLTKYNKKYIGEDFLQGAKRRNEREWAGQIHMFGMSASGVVTQYTPDIIRVRGCALVIVCESVVLTRYSESTAEAD